MKQIIIVTTAVLLALSLGCTPKPAQNQLNAIPVPVVTPGSNVNSSTTPSPILNPSPTQSGSGPGDPSFLQKMEQQQRESKQEDDARRQPGSKPDANSNTPITPTKGKPLPPGQKVF